MGAVLPSLLQTGCRLYAEPDLPQAQTRRAFAVAFAKMTLFGGDAAPSIGRFDRHRGEIDRSYRRARTAAEVQRIVLRHF
jgi:hypothetical protein